MNKICTTIEQSKKLLELGIDVNTSDMCWQNNEFPIGFNDDDAVPAWSLKSLLNIIENRKGCCEVKFLLNYAFKWVLTTTYYNSVWKEKEIIAECPIDAAFEMVVWLKENGRI